MEEERRVVLGTLVSLGSVGGLANYGATLCTMLNGAGIRGSVYSAGLSVEPGVVPNGWEAKALDVKVGRLRWLPTLARRKYLHSLAVGLAEGSCRLPENPRNPPEAVHFVGTGWNFFGFSFQKFARQSRAVFTVMPATHPGSWGDDEIDVRLYREADIILCLSDFERRHLANLGVPETNLVVTGLPPMCQTDGDNRRFRERYGLGSRPVALFIGRRDSGKGYPALLTAWNRVLAEIPDAVLVLIGPGGGEFGRLQGALPLGAVLDLGIPEESEKADALAACNVFCLPSAHESFGIVYVEAWYYGKPVICGTAPASREMVPDGGAGLHASQDPEVLSAMLIRLLVNQVEAEMMGATGKKIQAEFYTARRMLDDHLRVWGLGNSGLARGGRS